MISIGLSINLLFGVAKDIKDSFGIPAVVLLVVEDSTSLTTAENEIEDWLLGMRCTVVFADTEYMDESTYDGSVNWDTKDLAIIPLGTGNGTGMDTSKANGIGELPIICFEPTFWDSLGFPAQNSTHSNDSLLMPGTNTTFFDSIFTVDQGLKVVSAAQAHNKMKGGLLATNVVMLSIDKGDTICAYDTLNNQKRMAIGIETTTLLEVLP